MTSISTYGQSQSTSPRDRLQSLLQSEVSSGQVSQTDATAISSALDSIDQTLKADRPKGGPQGGPPPGPPPGGGSGRADKLKDKVDGLIQKQVDAGSLTSDQADELKSLLEQVRPNGQASSSSSTASTSSGNDTVDLLKQLLDKLQQQDSQGYASSGTGTASQSTPFLLDETA